jgi:hypothetical protein
MRVLTRFHKAGVEMTRFVVFWQRLWFARTVPKVCHDDFSGGMTWVRPMSVVKSQGRLRFGCFDCFRASWLDLTYLRILLTRRLGIHLTSGLFIGNSRLSADSNRVEPVRP